jgi:hypothetical protein
MRSSLRVSDGASALALTALLLAATARAGGAQVGNMSDVTGIPITNSSVVSPIFGVAPSGAIRVITFITPQVAQGYQQTAARVQAQLASQTFTERDGVRAPALAQNIVYEVASGGATSATAASRLVALLTTNNNSPGAVTNAEAFVESFRGLLAKGIAMDPRFFNTLTATQLANAVAAYNAFIDSSTESFLAAPPAELATIHSVLASLTTR